MKPLWTLKKSLMQPFGVTRRSAVQLRQKYLNIKKKAVKSSAEVRREIQMTGGGDSQKKIDPLEERILAAKIINKPLQTPYNSDSCYLDNLEIEDKLTSFMQMYFMFVIQIPPIFTIPKYQLYNVLLFISDTPEMQQSSLNVSCAETAYFDVSFPCLAVYSFQYYSFFLI